jgi:putative endonuclease
VSTGSRGEDAAAEYLKKLGYEILERNFRCRAGEIDIIAGQDGMIVFVEVKTRRRLDYGLPCEAVTATKKEHIRRVIRYYVMIKNLEKRALRIDVIEIFIKEGISYIHHIEDAF